MSSSLIVKCTLCGAVARGVVTGPVNHVSIEHENDCPFATAIEQGRGPEWVDAHGYPITYERAA
jgi:hypothetical protein